MAAGIFIVHSDAMLDKLIISKLSEEFGLQQVSLPTISHEELLDYTKFPNIAQKLLAFLRNPINKSRILKILKSSGLLDGKTTAQTVEMAETLYPELFQVCEAKIEFALLHANQLNMMQRSTGYKENTYSTPEKNAGSKSQYQSPYRVPEVAQVRLPIEQFEQMARITSPSNGTKRPGVGQGNGSVGLDILGLHGSESAHDSIKRTGLYPETNKFESQLKQVSQLSSPTHEPTKNGDKHTPTDQTQEVEPSGVDRFDSQQKNAGQVSENSAPGSTANSSECIENGDVYGYIKPNDLEKVLLAKQIFHLATPDIPIEAVLHNLFIQMLFGLPASDPEPSLQKLNRLFHKIEVAKTKKSLDFLKSYCKESQTEAELMEFLDLMDEYASFRAKVEEFTDNSRKIIKSQQQQWTEKCIYYPVYFTEQIHETFSRPYQRVVRFDHPPLERWKASQGGLPIEDYFKVEQLVANSHLAAAVLLGQCEPQGHQHHPEPGWVSQRCVEECAQE